MNLIFGVDHDYVMNAGLVDGGNTKDKNNYFDCHVFRDMNDFPGACSRILQINPGWLFTVSCANYQYLKQITRLRFKNDIVDKCHFAGFLF